MFGVIKNASNEFCPEVEQPTESNVSILPEMLDQLEIDENDDDCKHRTPTQITGTVSSLKSKVRY